MLYSNLITFGARPNYPILTSMALCEGCQEFKRRMLQSRPEFPREGVDISLHKSFAELSECVDSLCELCKYVRREMYFTPSGFSAPENAFDDSIGDQDREVTISLRRDRARRIWAFRYGNHRTAWRFSQTYADGGRAEMASLQ